MEAELSIYATLNKEKKVQLCKFSIRSFDARMKSRYIHTIKLNTK